MKVKQKKISCINQPKYCQFACLVDLYLIIKWRRKNILKKVQGEDYYHSDGAFRHVDVKRRLNIINAMERFQRFHYNPGVFLE